MAGLVPGPAVGDAYPIHNPHASSSGTRTKDLFIWASRGDDVMRSAFVASNVLHSLRVASIEELAGYPLV